MNKETIKAVFIAVVPGFIGLALIAFAVFRFLQKSYISAVVSVLLGFFLLLFVVAFIVSYFKDQKLIKVLNYEKDPQKFLELNEQKLAKAKNPVMRCITLLNITIALRYLGRFREALSILDSIAPNPEAKAYTKIIINCYADLCICLGDYELAGMHLENLKAHLAAHPEKAALAMEFKKSIDICYTEINIGLGLFVPGDEELIESIKNEKLPIKQVEHNLIIAKYYILKKDPAARIYLEKVIYESPKMYISKEAEQLLSKAEAV